MKDERPASALAALEALFAPKKPESLEAKPSRASAKIITARTAEDDPRAVERAKLLGRFLAAEGRPAVTRSANDFLKAGFTFADEQEVQLALLQHADERQVRDALTVLMRLLNEEPPKRKAVLEARLRSLDDAAEEPATRELAGTLRRLVLGYGRGRTP